MLDISSTRSALFLNSKFGIHLDPKRSKKTQNPCHVPPMSLRNFRLTHSKGLVFDLFVAKDRFPSIRDRGLYPSKMPITARPVSGLPNIHKKDMDVVMQVLKLQYLPLISVKPAPVATTTTIQMKFNIRPYFETPQKPSTSR